MTLPDFIEMKQKIVLQASIILCTLFVYQITFAQCSPAGSGTNGGIFCMYPDTVRDCLYVGGDFHNTGNDTMNHCTYWDDATYMPMDMMGQNGCNDSVWCFTYFQGSLYVGGSFTLAGGIPCNRIARWDGTTWHPVGNGFNESVHSLCVYNNELYAGGEFLTSGTTSIAHIGKWDGSEWHQVGNGTNNDVESMCVWNGTLCMGGEFTQAGGMTVNRICSWNGSQFSAMGSGFTNGMMGRCSVQSLCIYNGNLFAGGSFEHAGSAELHNLGMWNGSTWSSIGEIEGEGESGVSAMCVYNEHLYVGGNFGSCGSSNANNLGAWNGSSWSSIGSGMNGKVTSLATYNGDLYIAGAFTNAAGTAVNNIAKYSTTTGIQSLQNTVHSVSLYPNPANDFVQVNWVSEKLSPVRLVVTDLNGMILEQQSYNVMVPGLQKDNVAIHQLPGGIYFLTVRAGNDTYTTKFLIQ